MRVQSDNTFDSALYIVNHLVCSYHHFSFMGTEQNDNKSIIGSWDFSQASLEKLHNQH